MLILWLHQKYPGKQVVAQISFNQQYCKLFPHIYFSQNILSSSQFQYKNLLWTSYLIHHYLITLSWPDDLYFFPNSFVFIPSSSQKSHWVELSWFNQLHSVSTFWSLHFQETSVLIPLLYQKHLGSSFSLVSYSNNHIWICSQAFTSSKKICFYTLQIHP